MRIGRVGSRAWSGSCRAAAMARRWRKSSSSNSSMRRLRLTLGYRGTHYAGWGVQRARPTVQAVVEASLASALGHQVRLTAAGRTDAGVHADAQVVSFTTASTITPRGLERVLSTSLPDDVWVTDAADVP